MPLARRQWVSTVNLAGAVLGHRSVKSLHAGSVALVATVAEKRMRASWLARIITRG